MIVLFVSVRVIVNDLADKILFVLFVYHHGPHALNVKAKL